MTFTPDDAANYYTVVLTVSMTVNKATPVGTIPPTASAIAYGQTLAASILSVAATSVPGRFAFTSPGTVPGFLGAANQSATFTPDDATDYGTALLSVRVTVVAPLPFWLWTAVNGITGTAEVAFVAPNAGRGLPIRTAENKGYYPGVACAYMAGSTSNTHARFGHFQTDCLRQIPELHVDGIQARTCGMLANLNRAGVFP